MPAKQHIIQLSPEERTRLEQVSQSNRRSVREKTHARLLLGSDTSVPREEGGSQSDPKLAARYQVNPLTVANVRRRAHERGVLESLVRGEQNQRKVRRLDGAAEAQLVALTCSSPPDECVRWSLRLLRERFVELEVIESIGLETIRTTLKKKLKPWLKQMWCIPPRHDARFVAAMEDVLEVYARPYDAKRPVVYLDEAAKQLLGETREVIAPTLNHVQRFDSQYTRNGTCALFMLFEPLAAKRHVRVKERRTALDYAEAVRFLCEEVHAHAHKIVLVQDNLNTHGSWSLYHAFEPHQARRLIERIEWHYTPKHGSWLNMVEMELSVLARQCLQERMESRENLEHQVALWQQR